MATEDNDDTSQCIRILLRKYLNSQHEDVENFSTLLDDAEVISTNERQRIDSFISEKKYEDATEEIIKLSLQKGIEKLLKACTEEDYEGDKKLTELLIAILERKHNNFLKELLQAWEADSFTESKIKELLKEIWPNKTEISTEVSLTLYFLHLCVVEVNEQIIARLYERLHLKHDSVSSNSDEDETMYSQCLIIILRKYLSSQPEYTKHYAKFLNDSKIISKDERRRITSLIRSGKNEEASEICIQWSTCQQTEKLLKGCKDQVFQGDQKLLELITLLHVKKEHRKIFTDLVKVWDTADIEKNVIEQFLSDTQPEENRTLSESNWQLHFLLLCVKEERVEFLKQVTELLSKPSMSPDKKIDAVKSQGEAKNKNSCPGPRKSAEYNVGGFIVIDTVEFRVYAEDSENTFSIHLHERDTNTDHQMTKTGNTYSCCVNTKSEFIKYKYYLKKDGKKKKETLPGSKWRLVQPYSELLVHDVACFKVDSDWIKFVGGHIEKHLPAICDVVLRSKDEGNTPCYQKEIHTWVNQVKQGWKFDSGHSHLSSQDMEQSLINWLKQLEPNATDSSSISKVIVTTLALLFNLHLLQHNAETANLLYHICNGLSLHNLTDTDQNKLYKLICAEFDKSKEKMLEAFIWLYAMIERIPFVQWIYTLPLYWLIHHEGTIKKSFYDESQQDCLYSKSSLSLIKGIPWIDLRSRIDSKEFQKNLLAYSSVIKHICSIHPWIIHVYQYILSASSILSMSKEDIADLFQADFVLMKCLDELLKMEEQEYNDFLLTLFDHEGYFIAGIGILKEVDNASSSNERQQLLEKMVIGVAQKTRKVLERELSKGHPFDAIRLASFVCHAILNKKTDIKNCKIEEIIIGIKKQLLKALHSVKIDQTTGLQDLNAALHLKWSNDEKDKTWITSVQKIIKEMIVEMWKGKDKDYTNFYFDQFNDSKNYVDPLRKCFEDEASKCLDKELSKPHTNLFCVPKTHVPQALKLFSKTMKKKIVECKSPTNIGSNYLVLNLLKSWPGVGLFFQKFYCNEEARICMKKDIMDIMQEVEMTNNKLVSELKEQRLELKELDILVSLKNQIVDFNKILGTSDVDMSLETLISQQNDRHMECDKNLQHIKDFIAFCSPCSQIDMQELRMFCTIDGITLKDLIAMFPSEESKVSCENQIPYDDMQKISVFEHIKDSDIIQKIWGKIVDEKAKMRISQLSWRECLDSVFSQTREQTTSVTLGIVEGSISWKEVTAKFLSFWDEEKIRKELQYLAYFCGRDSLMQQCSDWENVVRKIDHCLQLKKKKRAVELITSFKHYFELNFDFVDFAISASTQDCEKTLNDIDFEVVLKSLSSLDKLTDQYAAILETVINQKEFIKWIKQTITDASEAKSICDMCLTSVGEETVDVDRVLCLQRVVTEFQTLIFDLDKISRAEDVIKRCGAVFENMASNQQLLKNLEDAGQCLEWYKTIKTLIGDDGAHYLAEAQEINQFGIYTIRMPKDAELNLNSSLTFGISSKTTPKKGKGERRYALSDLHDLQSRLMLMPITEVQNEQQQQAMSDIEQFNDLLQAVETLAKSFLELIDAGCMLFNDWSAVIESRKHGSDNYQSSRYLIILTVNFTDDIDRISNDVTVSDINDLSTVLKDTLKRWNDFITVKRLEHYFLNEYSIKQIAYLCKHLSHTSTDDLTDQVYVLLSLVAKDPTTDQIYKALDEAILKDESLHNSQTEYLNYSEKAESSGLNLFDKIPSDGEKKEQAIRILVGKHFLGENIAKAAVQVEGYESVENCLNWAFINEHDYGTVTDKAKEYDRQRGFVFEKNEVLEYTSVLHNRTIQTVKDMIKLLLDSTDEEVNISSAVKTVCVGYYDKTASLSLQDYLSVEHLGKFLSLLRRNVEKDKSEISEDTFWPLEFSRGIPNLIISQDKEVVRQVLALYMLNPDKSLPTASQVMICCESTSPDEVQRFMRRAMCSHENMGNMWFSLAFTEKLSFAASKACESIFNTLSADDKHCNNKYQLVIFTCMKQHYVTTCFHKYHVVEVNFGDNEVSGYLANKLKRAVADPKELQYDKYSSNQYIAKVVASARSGLGKTLHVKNIRENLSDDWYKTSIQLPEKTISFENVIAKLYGHAPEASCADEHFIHIDLTPAVQCDIERFFFNLLILGSIQDSQGRMWSRHKKHFYVIEVTMGNNSQVSNQSIISMLPRITCLSPREAMEKTKDEINEEADEYALSLCKIKELSKLCDSEELILMDFNQLFSEVFQRPFQYLLKVGCSENLEGFKYTGSDGTAIQCIDTLLNYCSLKDPSWAQLRYFVSFLNIQLKNCENSIFCQTELQDVLIKGLKNFAVRFMIKIAQDFTTPSLKISDQSQTDKTDIGTAALHTYNARRRWEETSQAYVFFNDDNTTMSFINVYLSADGDLFDKNNQLIEKGIATRALVKELLFQKVGELYQYKQLLAWKSNPRYLDSLLEMEGMRLVFKFDELDREQKLEKICRILGVQPAFDPDPTYELTTENVLKILAVFMRFKCGIPVILIGETGCGKTRMIEFIGRILQGNSDKNEDDEQMKITKVHGDDEQEVHEGDKQEVHEGDKQKAHGSNEQRNMITIKVHGGVSVADIHRSITKALVIADENNGVDKIEVNNSAEEVKTVITILFYDEANTTTAIYAIKEAMCDSTVDGESFDSDKIQIVAACNPFKKHSPEALEKLEKSGLGYFVNTNDAEKLGAIPMRALVYKVIPLPPSMQPFVWDFGELSTEAEEIYIDQMIKRLCEELNKNEDGSKVSPENEVQEVQFIGKLFSESQEYMRHHRDECRYTSLRDVERCIIVFRWFYKLKGSYIIEKMQEKVKDNYKKHHGVDPEISHEIRCLLQTLGICYHVSLIDRKGYREFLSKLLNQHGTPMKQTDINEEFIACQTVFLENIKITDNIACNEALRENVFLMAICAELRIPLYLIGKPGSSKSLAKTVISDNMEGQRSVSKIYQKMKQVDIICYQCSIHTNASGIEAIFRKCSELQNKKGSQKCTAVVVLDEIGLAEDSPKMPLKILHALLECGSTDGESLNIDSSKKVGFVGISNWALDPAKMNRGLFVTRCTPDKFDLQDTAKSICSDRHGRLVQNTELLEKITEAYLEVYNSQIEEGKEFFGLRDYYSLIKMILSKCPTGREEDLNAVYYTILRNFSGGRSQQHLEVFKKSLQQVFARSFSPKHTKIQAIIDDNLGEEESRYLLLLTNHHSSVSLLQYFVKDFSNTVQVIYGSSFPKDQNYTEVCRNINRVQRCMEAGRSVILLNMAQIHESLYDVLNQHYMHFGGNKYVDIGLGGHRVKRRVAKNFRLIVLEERDTVYREYPIPLVNRLEKHHLVCADLLTDFQVGLSDSLAKWTKEFSTVREAKLKVNDAFIGFNDDTVNSVILLNNSELEHSAESEDTEWHSKTVLLEMATADSVFRLDHTNLLPEVELIQEKYMVEQIHDNLLSLLEKICHIAGRKFELLEITTFANILSENDRTTIEKKLELPGNSVMLLHLTQFETQKEFANKIEEFMDKTKEHTDNTKPTILLIQCTESHKYGQLIACARYCLRNVIMNTHGQDSFTNESEKEANSASVCIPIVVFLLSVQRSCGSNEGLDLILQPSIDTKVVYIDELRPSRLNFLRNVYRKKISEIIAVGQSEVNGECEELVGIVSMLRDCVCDAMSLIKSPNESSNRNMPRIKALIGIFTADGAENKYAKEFIDILLLKMKLYQEQEEESKNSNWFTTEALSAERLQEGGTFVNTLILCLKKKLAFALAYIVSNLDVNNNLNFIIEPDRYVAWKVDLWLKMFSRFDFDWKKANSEQGFFIRKLPHIRGEYCSKFPFSFYLHPKVEAYLSKDIHRAHSDESLKHLPRNPDLEIINKVDAEEHELMESYAHDVVQFLFLPGTKSDQELHELQNVLLAISQQNVSRHHKDFNNDMRLSQIHYSFREYEDYIMKLSEMFKIFPELLTEVKLWIEEQNSASKFIFHERALRGMLKIIGEKALAITDERGCMEWMDLISTVKHIVYPLLELIEDEHDKIELQKIWEPLSLLDLLLMHLLPTSSSDRKAFQRYLESIVANAKRLPQAARKLELCSPEFLKVILNILRNSYEDIKLKLLISWQDSNCKLNRFKKTECPVILPCRHFMCQSCLVQTLSSDTKRKKCPSCQENIPKDFSAEPANLTEKQSEELNNFQFNCTSIFLKYLDMYCFSPGSSAEKSLVSLALNEIVSKTGNSNELKGLVTIDLNIATCSSILDILAKFNSDFVMEGLNHILESQSSLSNEHLITVILKYFEKEIMRKSNGSNGLEAAENMMRSSWNYFKEETCVVTVDFLKNIAKLRFALSELVQHIQDLRKRHTDDLIEVIIGTAKDICKRPNSYIFCEFIIKWGYHRFGTDWFSYFVSEFQELVPQNLTMEQISINYWVLLHNNYTDLQLSLCEISSSGQFQQLLLDWFPTSAVDDSSLLKICLINSHKKSYKEALMVYINKNFSAHESHSNRNAEIADQKNLDKDEVRENVVFTANLVALSQTMSKIDEIGFEDQVLQQLVSVVAGVVAIAPSMLQNFFTMMTRPSEVLNFFWPSMPESYLHLLPQDYQERQTMYECPNGHPYSIGDCQRPWTTANCPECGAKIGGVFHRPAEGNTRVNVDSRISCGYWLKSDSKNCDNPADRLTKQGASIVQFIVHTCMLIGLKFQCQDMLRVMGRDDERDARDYLVMQLRKNLADLAQALGRNYDESVVTIFETFRYIQENKSKVASEQCSNWKTPESRKEWEKQFRDHFLLPVFSNLDSVIFEAGNKLRKAQNIADTVLYRVVHEMKTEDSSQTALHLHPLFWRIIEHSNSSNLMQKIGDSYSSNAEILQIILRSNDLHLAQSLQKVLKFQQEMIERYQGKVDLKDTEEQTFEMYLCEFKSREHVVYAKIEESLKEYIELWNSISTSVYLKYAETDKKSVKTSPWQKKITFDSPIALALPSTRGPGLWAKRFAEFLIAIHNEFVTVCRDALKLGDSMNKASVSELLPTDFIHVDKRRDLLPMIEIYSSYKITADEHGRHHHMSYNIDALEKQAREKYVFYKRLIDMKTLPCITYPQDVGIGSDWGRVISNVKQVPLPYKIKESLEQIILESTPADVCEGVRTLTHAISFLAKMKVDSPTSLLEYLKNHLLLSNGRLTMIPILTSVNHTLALYLQLTWRKSVNFVLQGLNPYKEALIEDDQERINDEDVLQRLREAFKHMDVILFQQLLNEMLIKVPEYHPDWSLSEEVFPYLEFVGNNITDATWFAHIPEKICFKHSIHLFEEAVNFMNT